jgi:VanZ family protein
VSGLSQALGVIAACRLPTAPGEGSVIQAFQPARRRRLELVSLLLVAGVIGLAGLTPGQEPARNRASWDASGSLSLEAPAQLISEDAIELGSVDFSIALRLTPGVPLAEGTNQEILSLVDRSGEAFLLVGQFPDGFLLRLRDDNPAGDPKLDRYFDHPIRATSIDLTLHVVAGAIRFGVDGNERVFASRAAAPHSIDGFHGRVLLGSRGTGWPAWRGQVHRLAVWAGARGAAAPSVEWIFAGDVEASCPSADCPGMSMPAWVVDPSPALFALHVDPHHPARWLPADLLLNFLGFVPLGFLLARLRVRGTTREGTADWRAAIGLAIGAGLVVSGAIEFAQWWMPGRNSSGIDLLCNGAGSGVGATLAAWHACRSKRAVPQ